VSLLLDYRDFEKLLHYFEVREKDIKNIKFLREILLPYEEEFASAFYDNLMKFEDIKGYIPEEKLRKLKETIKEWYRRLLSGRYDSEYFLYLLRIAKIHVYEGIPPHYIIVAMNFVSRFCTRRIARFFSEKTLTHTGDIREVFERMEDLTRSLRKLLAMNEDILVSYYIDAELRTFMEAGRFERFAIVFSKKFAVLTDIAILIGLMLLAVFVVALFGMDVSRFFHGNPQLHLDRYGS